MELNQIVELAKKAGARIENWMTNPPRPGFFYMTPEQMKAFVDMVRSDSPAGNLACKSVQKRLATQWGYAPDPKPDGYKFEARGVSKIDVAPHGGNWKPLISMEKARAYADATAELRCPYAHPPRPQADAVGLLRKMREWYGVHATLHYSPLLAQVDDLLAAAPQAPAAGVAEKSDENSVLDEVDEAWAQFEADAVRSANEEVLLDKMVAKAWDRFESEMGRLQAPASGAAPTDAMVDAYMVAQRRAVEEADQLGRANIGGLHTNAVREACRAGLTAALGAAAPAQEADAKKGGV